MFSKLYNYIFGKKQAVKSSTSASASSATTINSSEEGSNLATIPGYAKVNPGFFHAQNFCNTKTD